MDAPETKHFSMVRNFHLADLFTIGNGFCGVGAIFHSLRFVENGWDRHLYIAAALIPVAIVFDFLDGRIARWRHKASPMGRELDSLADVISFGVAPSAIAFAVGLRGAIDQAILMYFTGCGLSRLARYNISAAALTGPAEKVKYFEGTPITFSLIPLGLLLIARALGFAPSVRLLGMQLHFTSLLFLISGSFMISKTIRIPKP
jgi:CDP-diacylglycerol--serine O-phosphatidyltransferase